MKQTKFKTFINYALAFFMAFFLFCSVLFGIIGGVVSPEYAKLQVKKSDYIALSSAEIEEGLVDIAIPGGLSEDFFEYGITKKTLEDNIYKFIDSVYKNKSYSADDSAFRDEITQKIYKYAEEKMPGFSDEISEQLDLLIDLCCERYMRYATPKVLQYVGNYAGKLSVPAFTVALVTLSMAAISFLFLHRSKAGKKIYRISFLGAALLLGALPIGLLLFAGIDKIGITSKPLFSFITLFIKTPLFIMVAIAVIIVLAVVLELIISKKKSLH